MTSYLLAGPAGEPVSLEQAKAFLRVTDTAEDGLIAALVSAARIHVEAVSGHALLNQSWRLVRDRWPADRAIRLPVAPMHTLTEIRAYDADGVAHQIDLGEVLPDGKAVPPRIILPGAIPGAPVLRARMGIEIDYVAGFGADPGDVPADLVQAVLVLIAYWYENRDAVSLSAVPAGFDRLVAPYRRARL